MSRYTRPQQTISCFSRWHVYLVERLACRLGFDLSSRPRPPPCSRVCGRRWLSKSPARRSGPAVAAAAGRVGCRVTQCSRRRRAVRCVMTPGDTRHLHVIGVTGLSAAPRPPDGFLDELRSVPAPSPAPAPFTAARPRGRIRAG